MKKEGEERAFAGDSDMAERKGADGVLDDAVAGAADRAKAVRVGEKMKISIE